MYAKPQKATACRPKATTSRAKATGAGSIQQTVSRNVVKARKARKMTQTKLAVEAKISRSALNAIEGGQSTGIDARSLVAIADALDETTTPNSLLGYPAK
jgi:DNA-binding Xre family transcriptional regulator